MPSTATCTRCGADVNLDDEFCGRCGEPRGASEPRSASDAPAIAPAASYASSAPPRLGGAERSCRACSYALAPSDRFCPQCGTPQGESASHATPASQQRSMWDVVRERLQRATLGQYIIEAELGRGGMAAVFLAHEIALDRRVAIKVMSPALLMGEGMVDRFVQEAMTVAKLSHPHIVTIHAVRHDEDLHYFVMKYIEGRSLDRIARDVGALSVPAVKAIVSQVASALHYAHRRGVIHRDVKPANIMLDEDGHAIVTDFGIARVATGPRLTLTGSTVGTPEYMSPEQCNAVEITGASDQYSLGIVAYELLTGVPPFAGSSLTVMISHTRDAPPPIRELRPDCPSELEAVIARMLEKSPSQRWPNLGAVISAIGLPPLAEDDPIQLELAALARTGASERPRISVPVSPPLSATLRAARADAIQATVPIAPTPAPTPPEAEPPKEDPAAVKTPEVASVRVEPPVHSLGPGDTVQLNATALGANGLAIEGLVVAWASDDPAVATVAPTGLVTGTGAGTATITATVDGHTASTTIVVAPAVAALAEEETVQLAAVAADDAADTEPAEVTAPVAAPDMATETPTRRRLPARWAAAAGLLAAAAVALWLLVPGSTPDSANAGSAVTAGTSAGVVEPPGAGARDTGAAASVGSTATANAPGDTTGGTTGDTTVTAPVVTAAAPGDTSRVADSVALTVSPAEASILVGDTVALAAALSGAPPRSSITWRSTNPGAATVSRRGVVRAVAPGAASIIATGASRSDTAALTVMAARIAALSIQAPSAVVTAGNQLELRAIPFDARRRPLTGRAIGWQSSDPGVAEVDATTGVVTGKKEGWVTLTAASEGVRDTVRIAVRPASATAPTIRGITAGGSVTCVTLERGAASCWGAGRASPAAVRESESYARLAVGESHNCALKDGAAYCWGANGSGQLGNGSTRAQAAPSRVAGDLRFRDISVGAAHTCAVTQAGKVYCWGANASGQLGVGSTEGRVTPTPVASDLVFASVSAGRDHTCGLTDGGQAYCWGAGLAGALGHGAKRNESQPVRVRGRATFTRIRAGGSHTCALVSNGRAYCWGDNTAGQLGDGSTRERLEPAEVRRPAAFIDIVVGAAHSCAITGGGAVYCWGNNSRGQLGTGDGRSRSAPTRSAGDRYFEAVAAGAQHTCAVARAEGALCWGDGARGQLGDGAAGSQSGPVLVRVKG